MSGLMDTINMPKPADNSVTVIDVIKELFENERGISKIDINTSYGGRFEVVAVQKFTSAKIIARSESLDRAMAKVREDLLG